MPSTRNPTLVALAVVIPFACALLLHAYYYWPFISDDALISLRYAARLLDGHGLTWTDGQPVEGYSNLLWILLVALLGALGVDLVDAARLLGAVGMVVAMFSLAHWYISRHPLGRVWFPVTIALLSLALGAPIAVWTIGGLEQPLYAALIAISIALMFSLVESRESSISRVFGLSFVLGLLCLTRPDGPIFGASASLALLVIRWSSGRRRAVLEAVAVLSLPILFSAGQLGFRIVYYGELVPNTALVKISPALDQWRSGLRYVTAGVAALQPVSAIAIACLAVLLTSPQGRRKAAYLIVAGAAWVSYIAAVGGDIFPAYRHLVPVMVIFAFAMAEGSWLVVCRLSSRPRYVTAVIVATLLLLLPYSMRQFNDKQNHRAVRERWEWQGRDLALVLKAAFSRQQPLLAVTAAGCLPYWSELPSLDMLGLNDHYLPRHPPPDVGQGFIGHELGDGAYVLRRNPDIIVFNVGSPPHFRSGAELERLAEFHERYVPVTVRLPSLEEAIIYFNKYSDKVGIGITRSRASMSVPGFLFRGEGTFVVPNGAGKLVARLAPGGHATFTLPSTSLEGWHVDVRVPAGREISSDILQTGESMLVTLRSHDANPTDIEEVILRPIVQGAAIVPGASR